MLPFDASENNLTQSICIPINHMSISFSFRFYKNVKEAGFHLSAKRLKIFVSQKGWKNNFLLSLIEN